MLALRVGLQAPLNACCALLALGQKAHLVEQHITGWHTIAVI
ncbi:hypothetical protein [Streptomyces swartbergensis]